MSSANDPLNVLAIEPFYGGSHRAYLEGVVGQSRHRWSMLTGTPVHWKWRMRSSPLELSAKLPSHLNSHAQPDVVWCSGMLDLPAWQGFAAGQGLHRCPTIVYFHESQWTYPQRREARVDYHFGYTNLMTALAADLCLFNSAFHQDEFLAASEQFVRRMPDAKSVHDFGRLRRKCRVSYPGFRPSVEFRKSANGPDDVLNIGWVSRWEYDKRPDRFVDLLRALRAANLRFRLVLLGARPRQGSAELESLRESFHEAIRFDGFADSRSEYARWLSEMDVVISTADHEFFGIAICEAISAGAVAVVPDRLSYPEIVATPTRYTSIEDAVAIIKQATDESLRAQWVRLGKTHIESLEMSRTTAELDGFISEIPGLHLESNV